MIQNLSVCLRVFKNVCNFDGGIIKVQTTNKIFEEGRDLK